ncbi:MAG: HD domain-containing protein [Bacteroidales bacterium]|nr:HD domain-containing protein [Bacteroidales bacterium]
MGTIVKRKIVNDPVYGFINIPTPFLLDIIDHPWFQRLRHIRQLGFAYLVYPGANHTRLQHAMGAMHLMEQAIESLRGKGQDITDHEAESAMAAMLLHDIGHGPFSHSLESAVISDMPHETLSLWFMEELNRQFDHKLDTAIKIFRGEYPKRFLCQLVSSQLDVDRMDYLRRDSFFSGVVEGAIGSDRIIKMIDVYRDELVVEAKGIYSIEHFLIARRFMYWQVYLHKTGIAADNLLSGILRRARYLALRKVHLPATDALRYFLYDYRPGSGDDPVLRRTILGHFAMLDDDDICCAVKGWQTHPDPILSRLCRQMTGRKLFRIKVQSAPFEKSTVDSYIAHTAAQYGISEEDAARYFVHTGRLSNNAYKNEGDERIKILADRRPVDLATASDMEHLSGLTTENEKYFICFPKDIYILL